MDMTRNQWPKVVVKWNTKSWWHLLLLGKPRGSSLFSATLKFQRSRELFLYWFCFSCLILLKKTSEACWQWAQGHLRTSDGPHSAECSPWAKKHSQGLAHPRSSSSWKKGIVFFFLFCINIEYIKKQLLPFHSPSVNKSSCSFICLVVLLSKGGALCIVFTFAHECVWRPEEGVKYLYCCALFLWDTAFMNAELTVLLSCLFLLPGWLDNKPHVIVLDLLCPVLGLQVCVATPGF